MALGFQKRQDELDEAAKRDRAFGLGFFLFVFVVIAAIKGTYAWTRGESFHSYESDITLVFLSFFAIWIAATVYEEFRIRTNGIYSKLKEIEDRLGVIEEALRSEVGICNRQPHH